MLRTSPSYGAAAILTLALGIGATTGIFTVMNGLLMRFLPVRAPDRLVQRQGGFFEAFGRVLTLSDDRTGGGPDGPVAVVTNTPNRLSRSYCGAPCGRIPRAPAR